MHGDHTYGIPVSLNDTPCIRCSVVLHIHFFCARFCNTDALFVNSMLKWHECVFVIFRRLH